MKTNKLDRVLYVLMNQVNAYDIISADEIEVSKETKIAVQSSIIELCTVITELVKKY